MASLCYACIGKKTRFVYTKCILFDGRESISHAGFVAKYHCEIYFRATIWAPSPHISVDNLGDNLGDHLGLTIRETIWATMRATIWPISMTVCSWDAFVACRLSHIQGYQRSPAPQQKQTVFLACHNHRGQLLCSSQCWFPFGSKEFPLSSYFGTVAQLRMDVEHLRCDWRFPPGSALLAFVNSGFSCRLKKYHKKKCVQKIELLGVHNSPRETVAVTPLTIPRSWPKIQFLL